MIPQKFKQVEAKGDGVINLHYPISVKPKHGKFSCSPNGHNQQKSTVELGYICPRVFSDPPALKLTE